MKQKLKLSTILQAADRLSWPALIFLCIVGYGAPALSIAIFFLALVKWEDQ